MCQHWPVRIVNLWYQVNDWPRFRRCWSCVYSVRSREVKSGVARKLRAQNTERERVKVSGRTDETRERERETLMKHCVTVV
jgi:hypothetical protein